MTTLRPDHDRDSTNGQQPVSQTTTGTRNEARGRSTLEVERRRRPATSRRLHGSYRQASVLILVAVLAAITAGWWYQRGSDQVEVVAVTRPVAVGQTLTSADLGPQEVSGVPASVRYTDLDQVVGTTTTTRLVPGELLTRDMVTTDAFPGVGNMLVALEVDATRVPQRIAPGDSVRVLAAPPAGDPGTTAELNQSRVLTSSATVRDVRKVSGGATRLTLEVDEQAADGLARYASASRVVVLGAPAGSDR